MFLKRWKKAVSRLMADQNRGWLVAFRMKTSLLLLLLALLSSEAWTQEVRSPLRREPLLEIFEPKAKGADMSQISYDEEHPKLTIHTVRDVQLASDHKGVLLILNNDDTKALAALTRDFDGRFLIFKSVGGVTRPININGSVEDGRIGFKYPEADAIAEQLRRYFHLGEFE